MSKELNAFIYFITNIIKNGSTYTLEDLFGFRTDSKTIIKNDEERALLNGINDILFENRNKDLTGAVADVNFILSMTLYYDKQNQYELKFSVSNYQSKLFSKTEKHILNF